MTHIRMAIDRLCEDLEALEFKTKDVGYVYNYLTYAREPFDRYLELYLPKKRPIHALFLGMNPGPWGTAQTGVPFGDVTIVKEWLHITGHVGEPSRLSPKRPIKGFNLARREVSGERLWGWVKSRWESPEAFFAGHFMWSHCPLLFIHTNGARNITPDRLVKADRDRLYPICDRFLAKLLEELRPAHGVGIGRYATGCLARVAGARADAPHITRILHPSPASPAANRDWAGTIERQLTEGGVLSC